MRFQNILLSTLSLLTIQSTNAFAIFNGNDKNENIFNYNLYCVEDNKNLCSKLNKNLVHATNSLTKVLDKVLPSPIKFEAFVDDVSKYRVDTSKDSLAFVLDTKFAPLNPKNNNTAIPYQNQNNLKKKLNLKETDEVKDRDFILLLNNFKSDKNYLKNVKDEQTTLIIREIFEALMRLGKIGEPYLDQFGMSVEELRDYIIEGITEYCLENDKIGDMKYVANAYNTCNVNVTSGVIQVLNLRKNETFINELAVDNEKKYDEFIETNKLPEVIQWKDTLISKGKEFFQEKKYEQKRIVVLGDVHGDYDKLKKVLHHAKLIDKKDNWIGTDSILVQVGDLTDRGTEFKSIIDLFIKIRKQAREKGGIVYMLLGNHELNNLQGVYNYISKSDFDDFGGYLNREKAISMEGEYGELIRKEMNITMNVDGNLIVHAGLPLEFAKMGIDKINDHAHKIFSTVPSFDVLLDEYYNKNKTHPLYTDPLFDSINGPLWTRYFYIFPDDVVCEELDKVLEVTKAKRMIVGHTPQEYGKISTRCDNKLIFVDVALSKTIGNYFGYLEILNNKKEIWARYH